MTDLATALATAGKALLDAADAITKPQEPSGATVTVNSDPAAPWTETDDWPDTPQARSTGGGCPIHDLPWTVRPAGVSKATGQPYNAFWKCEGQNDDGTYCREKPTAAWVKAHPAR